jgi:tRNA threonylcarbamoyladenosine biosynthesis protein TsaB
MGINSINFKKQPMKILSIDTAHGICSVTVAEDGVLIAAKNIHEQARQAEMLFLVIAELLTENKLSYSDIKAVAANIGPGSFTGVRIGLAAARGIALAAKIPIIGVTGFEAIKYAAFSLMKYENLLIAFDAKREQVFTKFYCNGFATEEELMSGIDVLGLIKGNSQFDVAGDAAALITPHLNARNLAYNVISELALPDAATISLAAFQKINSGSYTANPNPLYIRPPDAKLPRKPAIIQ